jgi:hypothetical protein
LKRKTSNKKNLIYSTLAICLIAGVWKLTSLESSSSQYPENNYNTGSELSNSIIPKDPNLKKKLDFDGIDSLGESEKNHSNNHSIKAANLGVSNNSTIDWSKAPAPGTPERKAFYDENQLAHDSTINTIENPVATTTSKITVTPKNKIEEKIVDTKTTTDNLTTLKHKGV